MAWVKLDDQFAEHPKLERAGALAGWMHVCALCYCARFLTDGRIPKGKALRLADVPDPAELAAKLVEVGLWEDHGDDYVIHDYGDYNPSRDTVEKNRSELSRKRAEAGRKGAQARWRDAASNGNGMASAIGDAKANERQAAIPENGNGMAPSPSPSPSPYPSSKAGQSVTSSDSGNPDDDDRIGSLVLATAAIVGQVDHERRRTERPDLPMPFPDDHRAKCVARRQSDSRLTALVAEHADWPADRIATEFERMIGRAPSSGRHLVAVPAPAADPNCPLCQGNGSYLDDAGDGVECECKFRSAAS